MVKFHTDNNCMIYNIEHDNNLIRYTVMKNKLWFVVVDLCRIIGANLANIYNNIASINILKVKIKKQHVRVTDYSGAKQILSTSRSDKVAPILQNLEETINKREKSLKNKLIEKKYLFNKCYSCGLHAVWKNKPLELIFSPEKDFLLCPNCFSQINNIIFTDSCQICTRIVPNGHDICLKCTDPKTEHPSKEKLKKELIKYGIDGVKKKYNIDKATIITWMKN